MDDWIDFRLQGDAYNVVFHTTGDAVAWAVAVQKELLRLPWPERLLEHPAAAVVHRTAGGVYSLAMCMRFGGSMRGSICGVGQ